MITEEVLAPVPPILALLRVLRRAPQEPAITLQMGLLRVLLEGAGIAGRIIDNTYKIDAFINSNMTK